VINGGGKGPPGMCEGRRPPPWAGGQTRGGPREHRTGRSVRREQAVVALPGDGLVELVGSSAAAIGSTIGVWSTSSSQAGGPRAGESTGDLVGSPMCPRMRITEAVSVRKAMMRISVPHRRDRRGERPRRTGPSAWPTGYEPASASAPRYPATRQRLADSVSLLALRGARRLLRTEAHSAPARRDTDAVEAWRWNEGGEAVE
jgi:hypothetical protein